MLMQQALELMRGGSVSSDAVQRWANVIIVDHIEMYERLLHTPGMNVHEKRKCESTIAVLYSIRQSMLSFSAVRGAGLARVSWDDVNSAFNSRIKTGVISNHQHLDATTFLEDARVIFIGKIETALEEHNALKVNVVLAAEYSKVTDNEEAVEIFYFNTKNAPIFHTTDLSEWFAANIEQPVLREMEEFQERDSDWTLRSILNLAVNINKFNPMRGNSYIPLPDEIIKKKACINVQNEDDKCFQWAILSALHPTSKHTERVTKYKAFEGELNFKGIEFPVTSRQIAKFEHQNDVSINLYILKKRDEKFEVSPCHVTKSKKEQHVNLLFVQDHYVDEEGEEEEEEGDEVLPKFHYVWIKDLSRLTSKQLSSQSHKTFICDRCLHYFRTEEKLKTHEIDCAQVNKCKVKLPTDREKILKFKNFKNNERMPFVVYADFECLLKPIADNERAYQQHEAFSVGFYVKCSYDKARCGYTSYRKDEEDGQNPAEWFVDKLRELAYIF